MTCLLLAALLAAAPPDATLSPGTAAISGDRTDSANSQDDRRSRRDDWSAVAEPRGFHELNGDLRGYIRGFARAEGDNEKAALVDQMCTLYLEIKRDPRLLTSDTLKAYKAKLWSVLKRIQTDLEQQASRQQRQRGGSEIPAEQRFDLRQPGPADAPTDDAADSLAGTLALLGGLLGGPGELLAHGGPCGSGSYGSGSHGSGSNGGQTPETGTTTGAFGGGAAGGDYGPALVELIQRTIAPEFWDVNGGPGTIVYYAPLRVLVVRATSEMHHDVGAAVGAVRRAGQ